MATGQPEIPRSGSPPPPEAAARRSPESAVYEAYFAGLCRVWMYASCDCRADADPGGACAEAKTTWAFAQCQHRSEPKSSRAGLIDIGAPCRKIGRNVCRQPASKSSLAPPAYGPAMCNEPSWRRSGQNAKNRKRRPATASKSQQSPQTGISTQTPHNTYAHMSKAQRT